MIAWRCGGSIGTNIIACATIIRAMRQRGETGSIVTLLCDTGERYGSTYYDPDWLSDKCGVVSVLRRELKAELWPD